MMSFKKSNQNLKKKSTSTITITQTRIVTETHRHVTVKTTTHKERSRTVTYSSNIRESTSSGSQISFSAPSNSLLVSSPTISDKSLNDFGKIQLDVKPVNLHCCQGPSGNSSVYSTFHSSNKKTAPVPTPIFPSLEIQAPFVTFEPKKLVVKKTGKLYDNNAVIPTYKTSSKNRGEVLIINNIMFKGDHERKGAKMDDQKLEDLFTQIGFRVQVKRDLKCKDMQSAIENFSKKSSLKSSDISVVVVMSHGTKHDACGTKVFGCDEIGLTVEDILKYFTSDKCKNMLDKPKIFIFQCCRGDNKQFVLLQTDTNVVKQPLRPHADMLIAHSTLPGFVAHRDPDKGTWYIQTLCEVFSKHAHEYHVEDLLKIVDKELAFLKEFSSSQKSSYESRGFKRCYFHPK